MTEHRAPRRGESFLRRHRVVTLVGAVVAVVALVVLGYALFLNSQLGNLARFDSRLDADQRATQPTGEAAEAQNILLLGTDKGSGPSIEEELADGEWTPGAFRSDTIMLLHVPKDRDEAFLVSIPRDTYVSIPGQGRDKINAAFSIGGPDLTVRTIEDLTGVYVDHVAMVDWAGFRELTHAIGGVRVRIPETFHDPKTDRTWKAGTHMLEGDAALDYVRTRYGLERGDLDRINRQQNFLRAALQKANSTGTLANPVKLTNLLQAVTSATTVDSAWSTAEIRDLALDLRSLKPREIQYLTVPTQGIEELDEVGSVVLLDDKESSALWTALRGDNVDAYLQKYGGDRLPPAKKVR